jgi:hypothetical protein
LAYIRFPRLGRTGGLCAALAAGFVLLGAGELQAWGWPWGRQRTTCACLDGVPCDNHHGGELGSTWYWVRSPDEEKRIISGLYNRYCIRCHGVDGKGVWDIPDVPDFTNARWQASRSDADLARITLEGRGAVMPYFRGTLTLEEAFAMARHLRTFQPESQTAGKP